MYGRVDQERYKSAMAKCLNYIPTIQGGLIRRSGTRFVAMVGAAAKSATRVVRFEFSTTQAYAIEFGESLCRFYKNNALITLPSVAITAVTNAAPGVVTAVAHGYSNGDRVYISGILGMVELNNREFVVLNVTANTFTLRDLNLVAVDTNGLNPNVYVSGGTVAKVYSISTPYTDPAKLSGLKFSQSADVLYITHPDYAPRKLTRTAHTTWTMTEITFIDGPYLDANTGTTTLTPSAATGSGVTLTASAVTGINHDAGFASTDVGRLIRLQQGTVWGYVLITAWTSTTVVTVTVINTLTSTAAKLVWRMGVWSTTTGFPSCVVFYEDRLFFAGTPDSPQRLDGSYVGAYENFTASLPADGSITASNAVAFTLNSNDVQNILWMTSDEKGLLAGTVKGEWVIRPSAQAEALSPTSISAKQTSTYGSANIQPVQADKATLFTQRGGRKIREMTYFYEVDGFKAQDLSVLSEHITKTGVIAMAYQRSPQQIIWVLRTDGVLLSMTYERDLEALRVGWARHILGGYSDASNADAKVESITVIPSSDGTKDELWMVVKRYINNYAYRSIEYLTQIFDDEVDQQDAFFVDCGATYDNPVALSLAPTLANPVVVSATSHGLVNGDTVIFSDVLGMTELNGNIYTVANKTANTFELSGIDGTGFTAWLSGGYVRKRVAQISGAYPLLASTLISALGDGAVLSLGSNLAAGQFTLGGSAGVIHVGFPFITDGQLLRAEAGAQDGTALGKKRRTHCAGFLVHRSLGLKVGMNFDELDTVTFRRSVDDAGHAPPLFSGIIESETLDADYDTENQICFRQDQPLPSCILAIMPQMVTQDRG